MNLVYRKNMVRLMHVNLIGDAGSSWEWEIQIAMSLTVFQ